MTPPQFTAKLGTSRSVLEMPGEEILKRLLALNLEGSATIPKAKTV
jgi:hypothetical protein